MRLKFINPTPEIVIHQRRFAARRMAEALVAAGTDLSDDNAVNRTLNTTGFIPALVAACKADAIKKAKALTGRGQFQRSKEGEGA